MYFAMYRGFWPCFCPVGFPPRSKLFSRRGKHRLPAGFSAASEASQAPVMGEQRGRGRTMDFMDWTPVRRVRAQGFLRSGGTERTMWVCLRCTALWRQEEPKPGSRMRGFGLARGLFRPAGRKDHAGSESSRQPHRQCQPWAVQVRRARKRNRDRGPFHLI
jgi:hypothetical protein